MGNVRFQLHHILNWFVDLVAARKCGQVTLTITRSPAQKPACKDLGRNGQRPTITPKATYTPVSNRADSRSKKVALRFNLRATLRGTTLIHQSIEPWPSSHTVRRRYASTVMGAPMTRY